MKNNLFKLLLVIFGLVCVSGLEKTGPEEQNMENTPRRYTEDEGPQDSDEREADQVVSPDEKPAENLYKDEKEADSFESDMDDEVDDDDGDFDEDELENEPAKQKPVSHNYNRRRRKLSWRRRTSRHTGLSRRRKFLRVYQQPPPPVASQRRRRWGWKK